MPYEMNVREAFNMRSTTPMKVAKIGSITISLLLCGVGILFILRPDFSIATLGTLIGIAMIVFGCIKIVGYLSRDLYRLAFQYDLAFGLLMIAVGIMVLLKPGNVIDCICVATGIAALMDGLLKVQIAIDAKSFGIRRWWLIIAAAVLAVTIGILLVFRTSSSARALIIYLGISMLADGILNLITVLTTVKIIRHQYPDVIEADFYDVDE